MSGKIQTVSGLQEYFLTGIGEIESNLPFNDIGDFVEIMDTGWTTIPGRITQ